MSSINVRLSRKSGNRTRRPINADELLLAPVTSDPHMPDATCDMDWIKEHNKQRFYVGGWPAFVNLTGMKIDELDRYRDAAIAAAKTEKWPMMRYTSPEMIRRLESDWSSIARPQLFNCAKGRAVMFPKAALFILTCELALEDRLEQARNSRSKEGKTSELLATAKSGVWIYSHMAIVPAVWNINDFNKGYLESRLAKNPIFLSALRKETGQENLDVFRDLASGSTVTYKTATMIKTYCDRSNEFEPLGEIRARAGKGTLGTKHASMYEEIDLD
jgi:hypothetical protein